MKGLELAKNYYNAFGVDMLNTNFSDVKDRIAVGLVGEGSECFCYDDDLSADHDFEPCFCMFITKEDAEKFGFKLERAYAKLPKEFMGYKRKILSAVGGARHGVIVIDDFYTKFLGDKDAPNTYQKWLYLPPYALACASNGEVFVDKLGEFSRVRNLLKQGYPKDVLLKKLSAHLCLMGQSGQYNYARCIERGESGAGGLAIFEFVKHAISTIYLLNNVYEPYYKWAYRGMRDLRVLSELEIALSTITEIGNSKKQAIEKQEVIEDIARLIISELKNQNLTDATCNNLETHAYSVMDKIEDISLRNMHVMDGI